MANRRDVEFTYSLTDRIIRLSLGEMPDFSGAKFDVLPRWLTSADFRLAFTSGVSANQVSFERELLDHYRLVFENRE